VLATEGGHFALSPKQACAAISEGYSKSLRTGGRPFVLAEENIWLRDIATVASRDPVHFWSKIDALRSIRNGIPSAAHNALESAMPEPGLPYRIARRVAGLGSLGHPRFVAVAELHGGRICREVKALVPSAVSWAAREDSAIKYSKIVHRAVRSPDPFVRVNDRWLLRRLAPFCSRIELDALSAGRDEEQLLFAMGWETANIHLGSQSSIANVRKHFADLKANWLTAASTDMADAITHDWHAWSKRGRSK
jgi:hypothetical protein